MEAMSVALRVGIILVLLLLMAFPVLPLRVKAKGISTFTRLRYDKPHNKKNIWFVFFTILEFILMALLAGVLSDLAGFIASIPFLSNLFHVGINLH